MLSKKLLTFLTAWILENTEFDKKIDPPELFKLSYDEMSQKACYSSKKCKVKAYYVKDKGIFYIDSMKPEENICDQSIILHELIHHYQKNTTRSFDLDKETIWELRERQALYYQNIFLISQKRKNNNIGPENVRQCEGGSYLDLQYRYNRNRVSE